MKVFKIGAQDCGAAGHRAGWRRLWLAAWSLARPFLRTKHRDAPRREEPRFDQVPTRAAHPRTALAATHMAPLTSIAPDAQRRIAYHARSMSTCAITPADTVCESTVTMDVIEASVDVVRRAKGKPTLAEIEPGMPMFEAHLEDFVLDVFQAMHAFDER